MNHQARVHKARLGGDYYGYTRYYFCCDTCGACGHHTLKHQTALDEATWHVLNTQEDNNGLD